MSDEPKKYGLQLNQKASTSSALPIPVASVFGHDSDSETEIANEKDVNKKFQMKYGSNKKRDERAVAEALADDPYVYEYDALYDQIQSTRNAKTEEQKEADKERKPKYAHKIVIATQKRQMEKLMVEERKQAKEREAEGDEFNDKDTFVTGAYRKQLEEKEKIMKELEEQERMDSRLKVEDQHFWQSNFNRKLLDDMSEPKVLKVEKVSNEEKKIEEDNSKPPEKLFDELKPGLNKPKTLSSAAATTKSKRSPTPERRRSRHDHQRRRPSSPNNERTHHRRRRHDSSASSPRERDENEDKQRKVKPKSDKEILYERLEKIKEILKQRNNDSAIFMARQRYLQRKQNGEIRAPI